MASAGLRPSSPGPAASTSSGAVSSGFAMLPSSHAPMSDSPAATPSTARGRAFARAALLGNPSDGFGGKTLGFTFAELEAEVTLGSADDHASDRDEDARRLVEATVARFRRRHATDLPPLSGAVRTQIPREVGLGGSSAIITATLRALCDAWRPWISTRRRSPRPRSRSRPRTWGSPPGPRTG